MSDEELLGKRIEKYFEIITALNRQHRQGEEAVFDCGELGLVRVYMKSGHWDCHWFMASREFRKEEEAGNQGLGMEKRQVLKADRCADDSCLFCGLHSPLAGGHYFEAIAIDKLGNYRTEKGWIVIEHQSLDYVQICPACQEKSYREMVVEAKP